MASTTPATTTDSPRFTLYVDSNYLSPYALSAFVALEVKGLRFAVETVDLGAHAQHESEFTEVSPTHRVPTLRHDDFSVAESSAICEYLESVAPDTPIYPSDIRDRARARQIQAWLRSDLLPIRDERPTEVIFRGESRPALSPAARDAAAKLLQIAGALLPPGHPTLFGAWCIADLDLAVMLARLAGNGDALPAQLAAYVDRALSDPPVQRWLALGKAAARSPDNAS